MGSFYFGFKNKPLGIQDKKQGIIMQAFLLESFKEALINPLFWDWIANLRLFAPTKGPSAVILGRMRG